MDKPCFFLCFFFYCIFFSIRFEWTNRDYFRENPQIAISLLSDLKADNSEYVRKSAGNALRDISKKFPTLIKEEISTWDVSDKKVAQVYKLAYRYIAEKSVDR